MSNNVSVFGDPNGLLEVISINGDLWMETVGLGIVVGYADRSINSVLKKHTPAKNTMLYTRNDGQKVRIVNEDGIKDLLAHTRVCGPRGKAIVMDAIERFHRDKKDIQIALNLASSQKQDEQVGMLVREIARMLNINIGNESEALNANIAA